MNRLTVFAQLLVLVPMLSVAAVHDWRTRRVPNRLIAPLALIGVFVQSLASGPRGLALAAGGAVLAAVCLLPFYLMRGMAAGDIKLMAAAGAWLHPAMAAWAVAFTCLAGAVLGLALWSAGRRRHGVPYAVAIATGTVAALSLMQAAQAGLVRSSPYFPTHGVSP